MKTITTNELKARIDAGEKVNLLDVRRDDERADFNVGGKHVSLDKIQGMQLDDIEDWKDEEIIIYCRSGNRSGQAAYILEQLGYKDVTNLTGGMLDWQSKF